MLEFEAIGTHWKIEFGLEVSADRQAEFLLLIEQRIAVFDRDYSRFRPDSLVAEMSQRAGVFELPVDAEQMMSLYERLYRLTDGAFTPLIGQLLVEAGYDASYSLTPTELHTPPTWDEVMEYQFPKLIMKKPALLDFGAIGKGYLIDIIGDILKSQGIDAFCIDAGGDILYRDPTGKPLRVGLEDPGNFEQVIGVATITNQSLCGSSGSRRAWRQFHHIMDPRTLASPRHVLATWTVADTAILADAMATNLFFVTPQTLLFHFRFEYLILRADYTVDVSAGFPAEVYTKTP